MSMFSFRSSLLAVGAAALVVTLAACGSTDPAGDTAPATTSPAGSSSNESTASDTSASGTAASEPATGNAAVDIVLTAADGCVATPDTVAAGAVTFNVRNLDAVGVFEVELLSDQRIRGERENLAPGFDATFTAKLDGGSYEIYCPGATQDRRPFTVTGQAAVQTGDMADMLQKATEDYADYIDSQVGFLVESVGELQKVIESGDLEASKAAYAAARPYFERIEPVAESFGDLDPAIDLRIADVENIEEWTGFHPIEKLIFADGTLDGAAALAEQLMADVTDLQQRTAELSANTRAEGESDDRYKVDEVANGAVALLDEVQCCKITGEEEAYSRIDLLDFAANVEGSQQAFAALQDALTTIDPDLVEELTGRFADLVELLDTHRSPESVGGYTLYDELTDEQIRELADAVVVVKEPLATVSAKIATA
jgi:iron uptake system component EfeO